MKIIIIRLLHCIFFTNGVIVKYLHHVSREYMKILTYKNKFNIYHNYSFEILVKVMYKEVDNHNTAIGEDII